MTTELTVTRQDLEDAALLNRVRECLNYDPETGVFVWKRSNSNVAPVGAIAGNQSNCDGYAQIKLDRVMYKSHRLAWFYVYGVWPSEQVDHINGVRNDNRISNLRLVSNAMNAQNRRAAHGNNKSGYLGVTTCKNGKYCAGIKLKGKRTNLGYFQTPEEAYEAYLLAKRKIHEGCTL